MNTLLKIFILSCGLIVVGTIVYLLMKRKISERNSLLWLLGSLVILTLSAMPEVLEVIAHMLGVDYPPSLLFLFSTLILLFITLYQSIQISILSAQVKELTQHVAINDFIEKTNHGDLPLQEVAYTCEEDKEVEGHGAS